MWMLIFHPMVLKCFILWVWLMLPSSTEQILSWQPSETFRTKAMKSLLAPLAMLLLPRACFSKPSTLPVCCKCPCWLLFGTMTLASQYPRNTTPPKGASPRHLVAFNARLMRLATKSLPSAAGTMPACVSPTKKQPSYAAKPTSPSSSMCRN